jgi:hypothetical protein
MKKQYIKFKCNHQKIERIDDFFVVGGSQNYLYAQFDFCEDWDGEQQYAVFTGDLKTFRIPIVNGECEVPWEMLLTKRFFVGCEAGQRITSNAAEVVVHPCGAPEETDTPRKPTPTLQNQIGDLADLKTKATGNLVAAINEVFGMCKGTISATSPVSIASITLLASAWVGSENLYSQVVSIDGVTENSQVNLTPSVEQLAIFYEKDITFITENDGGVVTIYVIGQKPANDYTIQASIVEVAE